MYENFTIFEGLTTEEIKSLNPTIKQFPKDSVVIRQGDSVTSFAMVVSGDVQVYNEDFYGNKNIIVSGGAGFLFGEALAVLGAKEYPVSIKTDNGCKIMFISYKPIIADRLLKIMAKNSVDYREKITLLSQRTTREKLLYYLDSESKKSGALSFSIPYDRQELADYLGVDRSAMSAEIGKLVKDGVIKTDRNWFELLKK